jgi:hypothetical protein
MNEDLINLHRGSDLKQRPSQLVVISPRSTERKTEIITAPAVIIKRDLNAK